MPLISSHLLIHASSATFVFLSYLLIASPKSVIQSPSIDLLGASMHVPPATFVPVPPANMPPMSSPLHGLRQTTIPQPTRELLALFGLLLFLVAVSQSVLASSLRYSKDGLLTDGEGKRKESQALGEEVHTLYSAQTQWMGLSALRVVGMGALVAWIYLMHSERNPLSAMSVNPVEAAKKSPANGMALLANRVVFALGMSDMLYWGYLWTVLKEEAREVMELIGKRRTQDE